MFGPGRGNAQIPTRYCVHRTSGFLSLCRASGAFYYPQTYHATKERKPPRTEWLDDKRSCLDILIRKTKRTLATANTKATLLAEIANLEKIIRLAKQANIGHQKLELRLKILKTQAAHIRLQQILRDSLIILNNIKKITPTSKRGWGFLFL